MHLFIYKKLSKISAEAAARTASLKPISESAYSLKLGSIGHNNLESVNRISGLSPSPRNSAEAIVRETAREDAPEEDDIGENPETKQQTAQVKEAMHGNEFAVQFGPNTVDEITSALEHSYKVFWDGSISLHKDTVHSSSNNKDFLNKLLQVRTQTEGHQEPPVTLIHGMETEQTLRETLLRIKVEQQEEAEAKARAAAEHVSESDAVDDGTEEQQEDLESKEEVSTF